MSRRSISGNHETPPQSQIPYNRERKFFGFSPLQLIDTVYDSVDDYLADAVDLLEREVYQETATIEFDSMVNLFNSRLTSSNTSEEDVKKAILSAFKRVCSLNERNASSGDRIRLSTVKLCSTELGSKCALSEKELRSLSPELQQICQNCADDVLIRLRKLFDTNFDRFEMYMLKNITRVPKGVQFPAQSADTKSVLDTHRLSLVNGDEGLANIDEDHIKAIKQFSFQPSRTLQSDEKAIDDERKQLRDQLASIHALRNVMLEEKRLLQLQKASLSKNVQKLNEIVSPLRPENDKSIETHLRTIARNKDGLDKIRHRMQTAIKIIQTKADEKGAGGEKNSFSEKKICIDSLANVFQAKKTAIGAPSTQEVNRLKGAFLL